MASRKRNAFSNLEFASKLAGNQGAAGSVVANYQAFKAGTRKKARNKTTALTPEQRRRFAVSLLPFGKDVAVGATGRYRATLTAFSNTARTGLGVASDADLGYAEITGTNVSSNYFPALLRPVTKADATSRTGTSGITARSYKYYLTNSYTIPFGRTATGAGNDNEEDRRQILTTTMKDPARTTPAMTVGYEPESWRYDASEGAGALAGLPTVPTVTAET